MASRRPVVLLDTRAALAAIEGPDRSVELPGRWEAGPIVWRGKALREGVSS